MTRKLSAAQMASRVLAEYASSDWKRGHKGNAAWADTLSKQLLLEDRERRRFVNLATALCKAGGGFIYRDDGKISNADIAKKLEAAVARRLAKRKGDKHG